MTQSALSLFLPVTLLALGAILARKYRNEWYFWTKPLPVTWILVWFVLHLDTRTGSESNWILAGLVLGLVGDILLLWKRSFLPGFAAFIGGHVAYVVAFAHSAWALPLQFALLAFVPAALYLVLAVPRLRKRSALPVVVSYMIFENVMFLFALNRDWDICVFFASLGAFLFCLSDGFWGWNRFVRELENPGLLILGTYYPAQALIAWGVVYF